MLFKMVEDTLAQENANVEVRLETEAVRLISEGNDNAVDGIIVQGKHGTSHIKANNGVVLACGGFEGSRAMQDQFWEGTPVLPQPPIM